MLTKLIELENYKTLESTVFMKDESTNPTGSIKDRMVSYVLGCALKDQSLRKDMTIVEASSGNTGVALAKIAAERGFPLIVYLADTVSDEKQAGISRYGAEVRVVELSKGISEIEKAQELSKQDIYYHFNQFENIYHVEAYRQTLAKELIEQLKEKQIRIDNFYVGIGSGASAIALGSELRRLHNPSLKIFSVIPDKFPTDIEGLHPGQRSGLKDFKIWMEREKGFEDGTIYISDQDAFSEILELERMTGLLPGPATGAVLRAVQRERLPGNTLIIATDSGQKYTIKLDEWRKKLG